MSGYEEFVDRIFKAIENGKTDKAPSRVEENIRACSQDSSTQSASLLHVSPLAWTLVRLAIDYDKNIEILLEQIDSSDVSPLASRLERHQSCAELFQQTFWKSQRAPKRRALLEGIGIDGSGAVSSDIRSKKKPRLGPQTSDMTTGVVPSLDPETTPHQSNTSAFLAHVETSETNASYASRPWPDAAVLPLVFPQKMCDVVLKYTPENSNTTSERVFAHIVVSWLKDPMQCSLDIGLTLKGASTIADKLFDKCISYQSDKGMWLLECNDGVEISIPGGFTFDRCSDFALKPLLGELVSTTFDNNPQRRQELKTGDRMTRLLGLTFGDALSPSLLRVSLDAEMLKDLARHLWPQY